METCDGCGNKYDKPLTVTRNGITKVFDSFECAIKDMAPICANCKSFILGPIFEEDGLIFCCAPCAKPEQADELRYHSLAR